jgi:hypothetical protein
MVDVPGQENETEQEDKPKKRGRPPGSATKKKTAAKKKSGQQMDKNQIKQLLQTVSLMTASRPGMEVWALTDSECDQIAEPLANILSKNEALSKMSEGSADAMALVMACFMIFIPKFLQWKATKPKKAKQGEKVNYGTRTNDKRNGASTNEQTGKSGDNSRPSDRPVNLNKSNGSGNGQKFHGNLQGLIEPYGGF